MAFESQHEFKLFFLALIIVGTRFDQIKKQPPSDCYVTDYCAADVLREGGTRHLQPVLLLEGYS